MRLRLPMHGRDHRPGGADPIPGLGGGGGEGDYVFLDEIVVESDADPIVFSAISQAYRHLVLEASLAIVDSGAGGVDLHIYKNDGEEGDFHAWGWTTIFHFGGAGTVNSAVGYDERKVEVSNVLPGRDDWGDVAKSYASVTMKLPYYALTDRAKGLIWQAISMDYNEDPFTTTGGGISTYDGSDPDDNAPITELALVPSGDNEWAAGCLASLYGIR